MLRFAHAGGMLCLMSEVTRILSDIEAGDPKASEQLLPLVYDELRKLAAQRLAQEKPGQTLQATALVHEAYLRLVGSNVGARSASKVEGEALAGAAGSKPGSPSGAEFANRGHFFAAAAEAMRRILVEQARRKLSDKRGGDRRRCELSDGDAIEIPADAELIDLDNALTRLAATDPQAAETVKLRVFAGMTVEEIAQVQGVSPRTVKRSWAYARAWLGRDLAAYNEGNS